MNRTSIRYIIFRGLTRSLSIVFYLQRVYLTKNVVYDRKWLVQFAARNPFRTWGRLRVVRPINEAEPRNLTAIALKIIEQFSKIRLHISIIKRFGNSSRSGHGFLALPFEAKIINPFEVNLGSKMVHTEKGYSY